MMQELQCNISLQTIKELIILEVPSGRSSVDEVGDELIHAASRHPASNIKKQTYFLDQMSSSST